MLNVVHPSGPSTLDGQRRAEAEKASATTAQEGERGGRGAGLGVGAVLTVSQGGSPVALQAEVVEHLGQLTATVDLGVAGGEQAAEQRGEGQQHATPRAQLLAGSRAPGFHAGGRSTAPATLAHNWVLRGQAVQQPCSTTHRRSPLEDKEKRALSIPRSRGKRCQYCTPAPLQPRGSISHAPKIRDPGEGSLRPAPLRPTLHLPQSGERRRGKKMSIFGALYYLPGIMAS